MAQVLSGLPRVIGGLFGLYEIAIFIYCFMSWIPGLTQSRFAGFISSIVDPFLNLIRRVIPMRIGLFDFSPIVALILVQVLESVIFRIL